MYPRSRGGLVTLTIPESSSNRTSQQLIAFLYLTSTPARSAKLFETCSKEVVCCSFNDAPTRLGFPSVRNLDFSRNQEEGGRILCWADVLLREIYQNDDIAHPLRRLYSQPHISSIPVMSHWTRNVSSLDYAKKQSNPGHSITR